MIVIYKDQPGIDGNETSWCFFCEEHTSTINQLNELKSTLELIMKDNPPTQLELTGQHDYEGNCAWDKLFMTFESEETIEFSEGYNGMMELVCYDRLCDKAKLADINELLRWVLDQIQNHIEYLEHCHGDLTLMEKHYA